MHYDKSMVGKSGKDTGARSRQFTHRAVLASDLDGTLAVNGVIHPDDRKAAARLKSHGISLLIVTGRNLVSLKRVEGFWNLADTLIFASGAGLQEGRDALPIERARLSVDDIERITTVLDELGEDYCLLDPVPDNHHFRWRRFRSTNPDFDARMALYSSWGRPDNGEARPASQALVIRPPDSGALQEFHEALSDWSLFHSASPIDGISCWLEIFPPGLDKGSALARWAQETGLTSEDFLALGNDFTDALMLGWGAHGRVVEGAPEELKQIYPVVPAAGRGGFSAAVEEAIKLFT